MLRPRRRTIRASRRRRARSPTIPTGRSRRVVADPASPRLLSAHPDRIIAATLAACPHCDHPLGAAEQSGIHAYDHIDLPPIRPVVTRVNRHRGVCPCCRKRFGAAVPAGFEPGSDRKSVV